VQPAFKPLLGEQHFSALMRSKPLARYEAYLLHAQIIPKQLNSELIKSGSGFTVSLGMVIPKKAYVLAVDRNRIRRVLRAHCALGFNNFEHDVHCLFRVKILPKNKKNVKATTTAKLAVTGNIATNMSPNLDYLNPHSRAFSQCVHSLITQAIQRLKLNESANLINSVNTLIV
jgi:ribonuclease P protein component